MFQGIRVSCNRTAPVGNRRTSDWTQQSTKFFSPVTGKIKKPRRKCLKNQVLTDGFTTITGATINKCEMITEHDSNGKAIKQVMIGLYNGKRVQRNGYAYGYVKNGKTPGRWYYV